MGFGEGGGLEGRWTGGQKADKWENDSDGMKAGQNDKTRTIRRARNRRRNDEHSRALSLANKGSG
jgi:hypothetical protein